VTFVTKPRPLSRRAWLGAAARASVGTALLAQPTRRLLAADATSITPYLLVVYASGGWDPTMVFDPKLGQGYTTDEPGAVLAKGRGGLPYVAHANRPAVTTFFEDQGDVCAIVNGLYVGSLTRDKAAALTLAAVPPGAARPADCAAMYATMLGPTCEMPHVVLESPYVPGDYASQTVNVTRALWDELGAEADPALGFGDDGEAALAKLRATLYATAAKAAHPRSLDGEKLRALAAGSAHEESLALVAQSIKALGTPPPDEPTFVTRAKVAIDLFRGDHALAASVQAGATGAWDTTTDHFARQAVLYQDLFRGLTQILAYAQAAGVDQRLMIVVLSERGRAPRTDAAGGKVAWPYTSALVRGPGVRGGSVTGVTDQALRGQPIDPLFGQTGTTTAETIRPAHLWAAIYLKTGVPLKLTLGDTKPLAAMLGST
jgi:uncharacterized protein (DUF1501 family)